MGLNVDQIQTIGGGAFTASSIWNGPVCFTCGKGYIGRHECKGHQCDATRKLARLADFLAQEGIPVEDE